MRRLLVLSILALLTTSALGCGTWHPLRRGAQFPPMQAMGGTMVAPGPDMMYGGDCQSCDPCSPAGPEMMGAADDGAGGGGLSSRPRELSACFGAACSDRQAAQAAVSCVTPRSSKLQTIRWKVRRAEHPVSGTARVIGARGAAHLPANNR